MPNKIKRGVIEKKTDKLCVILSTLKFEQRGLK